MRQALIEVFVNRRQLDPVLNRMLKEKKSLRGPGRQRCYDTMLGVFRWWSVLRQLLHPDDLKRLHDSAPGAVKTLRLSDRSAAALLLGALLLDNISSSREFQSWAQLVRLNPRRIPVRTAYRDMPSYAEAVLETLSRAMIFRPVKRTITDYTMLLPPWLAKYLPAGADVERLGDWMLRRPHLWLRSRDNDSKPLVLALREEGVTATPHPRIPTALCVGSTEVNLYHTAAFRAGQFEIQDISSQAIALACAPVPGERWWDPCAGAGGKTLALAAQLHNKGTVLAGDVRGYKLDDLRRRATRAGFSNIQCREWDGKPLRHKQQGKFDGVLVDAPCSCSGTWRRNPDARWTTDPAGIGELAALQREILAAAASGVKPGGVLVYATCSLLTAENELVVAAFLKQHPDFAPAPFTAPLTGESCDGQLRIYPWDSDGDAMFIARMTRNAAPVPVAAD
ncbi:MAG: RsmB/NOP family class I SAM-dependent RNA methyltransferase [Victivallales bacterium]|nr:RsmB/NOP family class I SAM-dependent RNA methyltransferase [Victivallales bacterium]